MGQFPIEYTDATVSGRGPSVRANIDVSTGAGAIGAAVAGLGGAIANLGEKYYNIEAQTQLDDAIMNDQDEHIRYILGLRGIEDTSEKAGLFKKAFDDSMETRQGFMPTNKLAAQGYNTYLKRRRGAYLSNTVSIKLAKTKDNFRANGFRMRQKYIETGSPEALMLYDTHLEQGRSGDIEAYTDEQAAKYRQATIDSRERYVKLQTAEQLEQLEIQREINRDEISKLIRAGESADVAIEESSLDEKEQFVWFERQRLAIERRLSGEPIAVKQTIKGELESMAYDISTGAVTMAEFNKRLTEERYGKETIDDGTYDELFSLAERKFESYQSGAMKEREVFALGQLVDLPSEEIYDEMLARLTSKFAKDQLTSLRKLQYDNLDQYKKALRDWLKVNKDANADEIYIEGRRLLTQYRKTPDQLRGVISPTLPPLPGHPYPHKGVYQDLGIPLPGFSFSLDALNRVFKALPPEQRPAFEAAWKKAKAAGATQEEFLAEWNK